MPQIIPIKELRNTNEISERCHAKQEPIFVTKNGYGGCCKWFIYYAVSRGRTENRTICR